eukprot:scaffold8755_cov99-Isochrysis_galbana.AAC.4
MVSGPESTPHVNQAGGKCRLQLVVDKLPRVGRVDETGRARMRVDPAGGIGRAATAWPPPPLPRLAAQLLELVSGVRANPPRRYGWVLHRDLRKGVVRGGRPRAQAGRPPATHVATGCAAVGRATGPTEPSPHGGCRGRRVSRRRLPGRRVDLALLAGGREDRRLASPRRLGCSMPPPHDGALHLGHLGLDAGGSHHHQQPPPASRHAALRLVALPARRPPEAAVTPRRRCVGRSARAQRPLRGREASAVVVGGGGLVARVRNVAVEEPVLYLRRGCGRKGLGAELKRQGGRADGVQVRGRSCGGGKRKAGPGWTEGHGNATDGSPVIQIEKTGGNMLGTAGWLFARGWGVEGRPPLRWAGVCSMSRSLLPIPTTPPTGPGAPHPNTSTMPAPRRVSATRPSPSVASRRDGRPPPSAPSGSNAAISGRSSSAAIAAAPAPRTSPKPPLRRPAEVSPSGCAVAGPFRGPRFGSSRGPRIGSARARACRHDRARADIRRAPSRPETRKETSGASLPPPPPPPRTLPAPDDPPPTAPPSPRALALPSPAASGARPS